MKMSATGTFKVVREDGICIAIVHVASGKTCGSFSHIAVRAFKAAIDGINDVEKIVDVARIADDVNIQREFVAAMRNRFPNGAFAL